MENGERNRSELPEGSSDRIIVEGVVATTDLVELYGVQLSESVIRGIAASIADGRTPFQAHHRIDTEPLDVNILVVEVRETSPGHLGVWVQLDIARGSWELLGSVGGFSITVIEPYIDPDGTRDLPIIHIAADAYSFTDQTRFGLALELSPVFSPAITRLYQFSAIPPPNVIVELLAGTLLSVPPEVISGLLVNAFSRWLFTPRAGGSPNIHFRVREDTEGRLMEFSVSTDDRQVLKKALDQLPSMVQSFVDQGRSESSGSADRLSEGPVGHPDGLYLW